VRGACTWVPCCAGFIFLTILTFDYGVETLFDTWYPHREYIPPKLIRYEITILSSKSLRELTYEILRALGIVFETQKLAFISDRYCRSLSAIHSHHLSRRNIPFLCRWHLRRCYLQFIVDKRLPGTVTIFVRGRSPVFHFGLRKSKPLFFDCECTRYGSEEYSWLFIDLEYKVIMSVWSEDRATFTRGFRWASSVSGLDMDKVLDALAAEQLAFLCLTVCMIRDMILHVCQSTLERTIPSM
jgi:hypothetical protein